MAPAGRRPRPLYLPSKSSLGVFTVILGFFLMVLQVCNLFRFYKGCSGELGFGQGPRVEDQGHPPGLSCCHACRMRAHSQHY